MNQNKSAIRFHRYCDLLCSDLACTCNIPTAIQRVNASMAAACGISLNFHSTLDSL